MSHGTDHDHGNETEGAGAGAGNTIMDVAREPHAASNAMHEGKSGARASCRPGTGAVAMVTRALLLQESCGLVEVCLGAEQRAMAVMLGRVAELVVMAVIIIVEEEAMFGQESSLGRDLVLGAVQDRKAERAGLFIVAPPACKEDVATVRDLAARAGPVALEGRPWLEVEAAWRLDERGRGATRRARGRGRGHRKSGDSGDSARHAWICTPRPFLGGTGTTLDGTPCPRSRR